MQNRKWLCIYFCFLMQAVWRQRQHPSVSRRSTPDCMATQRSAGSGPADGTRTNTRGPTHTHKLCDLLMQLPAGSTDAFDQTGYIGNVCKHTALPLNATQTHTHNSSQTLGLSQSHRDSNQRDGRIGCDRELQLNLRETPGVERLRALKSQADGL